LESPALWLEDEKEGKRECAYGDDFQCKTAGVIYKL